MQPIMTCGKSILRRMITASEKLGLKLKKTRLSKTSAGRRIVDLVLLPSDFFKIITIYRHQYGRLPNLIYPKGFNELLQRSKIMNRKERYTKWADKITVREYVKAKIGEQYLVPLLWHGESLAQLDKGSLPKEFVVKVNQGSGSNIFVLDRDTADWSAIEDRVSHLLRNDNSLPYAEWQYRWIHPQILIEELLKTENGEIPIDFKFFCFHGRVHLVQVDFDRFSNHQRNIYDRNFVKMDVEYLYPNYQGELSKPDTFDEMVRLAEHLSVGESFLRVDFYDLDGPKFGEITLHPDAGHTKFIPASFDLELGALYRNGKRTTQT